MIRQYEREKSFVLLVARGNLSIKDKQEFEKLLNAGLDWDYALSQLKQHKLFPLLFSHMESTGLVNSLLDSLIKKINDQWVNKSRMLDTELCRLKKLFTAKGIIYAVLKGPILAHAIYNNPRNRIYSDIDILIKKSDANYVTNFLKEEEYKQGEFDDEKKEFVLAPRKVVVGYSMYMHQLYPFKKLGEQSLITIDVHTKLYAPYRKHGENEFNIDVSTNSDFWQTLETIEFYDERIYTVNWNYFLLQLCMHAYVDEVSIFSILYGNGANLRAYCDIRELIISENSEINCEEFVEIVNKTNVREPIYYILANLSELYDDLLKIISPILERIRPTNLDFMNEFGYSIEILGEQRGQYSKPFRERIFDNSSKEDFKRQKHLFRTPQSQLQFFTT
jgi:hypothetical protein